MADVDDRAAVWIVGSEEPGDFFDRRLRRRQPDTLECLPAVARRAEAGTLGDGREPLERQREVCSPARADDGVDLVDDDRAHRAQHLPAAVRCQEQIQRLRGRHQNVRRRPQHRGALRLRRIAGPHGSRDPRRTQSGLFCQALNGRARLREILVNVRAERLERRDVENADLIWQRRRVTLFEQRVNCSEERCECFA